MDFLFVCLAGLKTVNNSGITTPRAFTPVEFDSPEIKGPRRRKVCKGNKIELLRKLDINKGFLQPGPEEKTLIEKL